MPEQSFKNADGSWMTPDQNILDTELDSIVDKMLLDGADEDAIKDVVGTYKQNKFEKDKNSFKNKDGSWMTPEQNIDSISPPKQQEEQKFLERTTEEKNTKYNYKPKKFKNTTYDDSVIETAVNDWRSVNVSDEQIENNNVAAQNYVDAMYDFEEKRDESFTEKISDYTAGFMQNFFTPAHLFNNDVASLAADIAVSKAGSDIKQQKEFVQKKKDLDVKARQEIAKDNKIDPNDKEAYEKYMANISNDDVKERAKALYVKELNSKTRLKNLTEKLDGDITIGNNLMSFFDTSIAEGDMPEYQKKINNNAQAARKNLDVKIKNHVDKQKFLVNNIKEINKTLKSMSADGYKSNQINRLDDIDKLMVEISEGSYTTPGEVEEANRKMQDLVNERAGIADGFKLDQNKFETLQAKSKELFEDLQESQKESVTLGETDAELNTLLDAVGRRYGIVDQAEAWLGSAALSLGSGLLEGVEMAKYSALNFANENIEKIPTEFLPLVSAGNYFKKQSDEKGFGKISDMAVELSEKLTNGVQAPPQLEDAFTSWGNFGEFATHLTFSQLPNTAMMIAAGPASLGLMGLSATGNKFRSMEEEIKSYSLLPDGHPMKGKTYTFAQMYATSIITGGAEALSEKITLGQLDNIVGRFARNQAARGGIKNYLRRNFLSARGIKNNIYDPIEEGFTESISQLTGNIADRFIAGKSNTNLYEGVGQSFVSGAWMSGVVYKAPLLGQALLNPFQANTSVDLLQENAAEIMDLHKQLNREDITDKTRKALEKEVVQKVAEQTSILDKDIDNIDKMPAEDKQALLDIAREMAEAEQRKADILEEPAMSDEAKDKAVSQINNRVANLKVAKNQIIAPYNKDRNDAIINKKVEQIKKKAKSIFGDAVSVERNNASEAQENFEIFLEQQKANTESQLQDLESRKKDMSNREYLDRKTQLESNLNDYSKANIKDAKYEHGFVMQDPVSGDQKIIVNTDVSGNVNVAAHEMLHAVLHNTLKDNPEAATVLGASLMQELAKIDLDQVESSVFRKRLEAYNNNPESVQAEEVMTLFSDAVESGDIVMPESVMNKVGNSIRRVLQAVGLKDIKFKNSRDVYNFVNDYNASVNSVFGNKAIKKGATQGFEISGDLKNKVDNIVKETINKQNAAKRDVKKSSLDATDIEIDNAESNAFENEVQDLYDSSDYTDLEKNFLVSMMYDPRNSNGNISPRTAGAKRIANMLFKYEDLPSYSVNRDAIIDSILNDPDSSRSIRSMVESYDPNMTDDNGNKIPLSGYIGSILSKRGISETNWGVGKYIKDAQGFNVSEDAAANLTNTESELAQEIQRRTLLDAKDAEGNNVIIPENIEKINGFLNTVMGTKLPKLDASVGTNKSVTPFVSVLKKELGRKNDVAHKAMMDMLGKNPAEVKAFLSNPDFKELVLDVLPTTWLASNIPSAVEKLVIQEDGTKTWTTDHVGRTKGTKPGQIDFYRSTEEGPYKGMTDGKQKIRRNNKAVDDVNFEDVLMLEAKTMTDLKRGNKKQGKIGLDGMTMALAQEAGFELLVKDMQDGGPLSELFKGRQDIFDRILQDNYTSEIIGQLERGTVKMSKGAQVSNQDAQSIDVLENIINMVADGRAENINEAAQSALGQMIGEATRDKMVDSGVFDLLVETEQMFGKPLKEFDGWRQFQGAREQFLNETATSEGSIEALAQTTETMIDQLPPGLLKIMGPEFFGFSKRLLDPAATKKDKNGKIIPGAEGKYAWLKRKFDAKVAESDSTVYGFEDAEVLQAGTGIMGQINTILEKGPKEGETVAEAKTRKINEIKDKFGDRIARINAANPKAVSFIQQKMAEVIAKADPSKRNELMTGVIRLFQGASSNGKGVRGLTTLSMIEVYGESMAVSNKDGSVNTKHPLYKQAVAKAKTIKSKTLTQDQIIKGLLRQKGEHQDVSANVNRENMKTFLTHTNLLVNHPNQSEFILEKLNDNIEFNIRQYTQVQNVKINSDVQDDILSSTSSLQFARMLVPTVKQALGNYIDTNTFEEGKGKEFVIDQIWKGINALKPTSTETLVKQNIQDEAVKNGRSIKFSKKPKGITVLDFDDTLATSKSLIEFTRADGTEGTLTPSEYARDYQSMLGEGTVFDFSQFNEVIDGKVAPLFQKALKLQSKFGPKDMFVLTARPAESAPAIFAFLQANGLNIPIENITGLANSTSEAKALWMADKVGEGYNDFYFADDALQNVQAVDNILEQFDVKRKVQQAKVKFSKDAGKQFNDILEESEGIKSEAVFSDAKARKRGENIGKYNFFLPPSAEDFKGLIYKFLAKGKKGEQQLKFFQDSLMRPFARAMRDIDTLKQRLAGEWRGIKKAFPKVKSDLSKSIPTGDFTYDTAMRVYLWTKAGIEIPGISKKDQANMVKAIEARADMVEFATRLKNISKEGYPDPGQYWNTETIASDLNNITEGVNRKELLQEFIENRETIFGKWQNGKLVGPNMNKIEAVYGTRFREALEDMLWRMENGTNRNFGSNRLVNRFANWTNNSIGAIMFLNMRSAVLQTLSTVNFINWEDNNIFAAGKAFANQPQFWKDFSMLWNSDMLRQRRSGLRTDVSQAELAEAASGSKNKAKAVFQYLLAKGFTPTQIMDSFAIASGGASFYRNRVNKYVKQGLSLKEAEQKAFVDFQEIAEETQQSSRPDLISQQQASVLGRLILAFQNTPMQYTRLTKKAVLDLINGRGSRRANISKILYYGAIQNAIFSSLQTALFALMFVDDEEEKEEKLANKKYRIINSMADSVLRGSGVHGAVISTIKNMVLNFKKEQEKDWNFNIHKVGESMLQLSPPIGSKIRKVNSGQATYKYNREEIKEMPLMDINNPIWQVIGQTVSGVTNFPLDRAIQKTINVKEALNRQNEYYQRISLFLGFNTYDLDIKPKAVEESTARIKQEKKRKKDAEKLAKKKEKEKLRKEKEAREVQCSAKIRKGKGPRCKNRTENKNGKCYAHQ